MATAIGIDIGSQTIKVVELAKTKEGVSLLKACSAEAPFKAGEAASPIDKVQRIAEVISRLLGKEAIKPGPCVVALPGQYVFIRFIEILEVSREKVAQTVAYEAKQQIPFSLDEVAWDYQLLPRTKPGGRNAILVAVKKDLLEENVEVINKVKLISTIIDASPLALYNCLKFNADYEEAKLSALIDIGAKATNLVIFKGDELWVRSFPLAGNKFTEALEQRFNLSFEEAERLKRSELITREEYKEALRPVLEDLLVEIERSIECYHFELKKTEGARPEVGERERIGEVLLSGGSANLEGLDRFLEERLSAHVRVIDPFKKLTARAPALPIANHQFGVAVGAALRQLERLDIEVNFLKEIVRKKRELRQALVYRGLAILLACASLFIFWTLMTRDYNLMSAELEKLDKKIELYKTYAPKIEDLKKNNEALARKAQALYRLAKGRGLWLDVILEVEDALPSEVWVTDLASTLAQGVLGEGTLSLSGKALAHQAVNDFVTSLKASPFFENIKPISLVEKAPPGAEEKIIEFTISMDVRYPKEEE